MSDEPTPQAVPLVGITMAPQAAVRLRRALLWAAYQADEGGRHEDYEWLMWGVSRISQAVPVVEDAPEPEVEVLEDGE